MAANVFLVEWLLLWLSMLPSTDALLLPCFAPVCFFFFPFIWDETGRSARAPLQAVVSLLSLLVAFLSSIEVSFGC